MSDRYVPGESRTCSTSIWDTQEQRHFGSVSDSPLFAGNDYERAQAVCAMLNAGDYVIVKPPYTPEELQRMTEAIEAKGISKRTASALAEASLRIVKAQQRTGQYELSITTEHGAAHVEIVGMPVDTDTHNPN